jgi:nucleoside-diphosphate-sugar epimerase
MVKLERMDAVPPTNPDGDAADQGRGGTHPTPDARPTVVALTGAARPLGRKVRALLTATTTSTATATGAAGDEREAGAVEVVDVDTLVVGDELKRRLEGAAVVLHLDGGTPAAGPASATGDVEATRRVLEAASAASVAHVVVLSDATAYGAWPNNPVPLTEDAVLRPNPGFAYAAERAEIERLAGDWRTAHPGATVTVLRAARTPGHTDWLIRALRPSRAIPELAAEPPAQFLHLDDLAAAVVLAARARLDGAFNVAPDGSIPGEQVRSLTGAGPKVRLPERLAARVVRWRFRSGLAPTPPELLAYTLHSWVVANDRLKAAGWRPAVTNEEACVDAHEAGPWATLSPRRRQEIALGVAGAALVGTAVGAGFAVRRLLRRGIRPGPS